MIMKYNFDKIPNRRGTNSLKWDVDRKELPMWVADMDFETVPEVQEALVQRVAHGVYGYSVIPDEWADSYVNWWEKRHHFRMDPKKLIFTTGVIPALSSAVRKLTTPAENVLIQTPVYNNFFNSIRNNGRNVVENELLYDGKEYRIDWEKLEQVQFGDLSDDDFMTIVNAAIEKRTAHEEEQERIKKDLEEKEAALQSERIVQEFLCMSR